MGILSNATLQFIISTSLTLLLGGISVWLALRRHVQIALSHETLLPQPVDPSNEEVRDLLAETYISPDDSRVQYLNFVTFKLWNSGRESITSLTDDKPATIVFPPGATILACEEIGAAPKDLEYSWHLEDEKILLAFPLFDPKDLITIRVLIPGRIDDSPDVSVRVPGSKRIVRANNLRQSKEWLIIGICYLVLTTYLFVSTWSVSPSPYPAETIGMFYGAGILVLGFSWLIRSFPPDSRLPSKFLWEFIQGLPGVIPIFLLGALIDHWFGRETLINVMFIASCLVMMFMLWLVPYLLVTSHLKKKEKKYNAVLVGVLASIPSLAFLALCMRVILSVF